MGDTDVESMARKLYFKHRAAIQLMNPAIWKSSIKIHLDQLIEERAEQLQPEGIDKTYIHFRVRAWDAAEGLKAGITSSTSYPSLFFGFHNYEESLTLYLWVKSSISRELNEKIRGLAREHVPPFCEPVKYDTQWHYCYRLDFLVDKDYQDCSDVELKTRIDETWSQFIDHDLLGIVGHLGEADWFMHASDI